MIIPCLYKLTGQLINVDMLNKLLDIPTNRTALPSRVCITGLNSPNPSHVYIRLCKHGKHFLLLKQRIRTKDQRAAIRYCVLSIIANT